MTLRDDLKRIADGIPTGGMVSLPVDWIRSRLEEDPATVSKVDTTEPAEDLTIEEAAKVARRSTSTVRGWAPDIPGAFKVHGRDWRIPADALRKYMRGTGGDVRQVTHQRDEPTDLSAWRDHVNKDRAA